MVLIHGPVDRERRILRLVGLGTVLCASVAAVLALNNPFATRPAGTISVTIESPYVGQGVGQGTAVILHGVEVGEVTTVKSETGGGVRLTADLQSSAVAGLTDTMGVDFRPINYFGVTGINLLGGDGGTPLRDGTRITTVPHGNFTLQALLSQLGEVSTGVLTPQLVQVVERATRYTDALNPLIETALITANSVTQVQTVSTETLLANATGLSVVFPSTVDALVNAGDSLLNDDVNWERRSHSDYTDEEWENLFLPTLELASGGLFADIGKLESSHLRELRPVTDIVKALTDVVPPLVRPEGFAQSMTELRTRFERLYGGTPEQRALQVRVVLDSLPGVAAPLGALGGPAPLGASEVPPTTTPGGP
ncbi:MlaD family protein [Mycolicibacterium thermoresistibile]